ncbi:formin-like protein 5 [Schistocerca americana]|uniref:formin-like protein 5 n=1 Tax=Schistocerca americana TaxID=7009 RepID=UPI001F4FFA97|nr:formin-like protein 5 [Schistocerca americana]
MTQLVAGLVTLQAAATTVPAVPRPKPIALPFHAFNSDVERWPEHIAQFEAHSAAYNIPELDASRLPPARPWPHRLRLRRRWLCHRWPGLSLPAPRPRLRPPLSPRPPSRFSAVPEPMYAEAEAAVTPPPPTEVVAPPPHPGIPSGGARSGHVFEGAFSSPPYEQFGDTVGQHAPAVPLSAPSVAPLLGPSSRRRKPYSMKVHRFRRGGVWYR